jgi:hypothetical protein
VSNIPTLYIKRSTILISVLFLIIFAPCCSPLEQGTSSQPGPTNVDLVVDGTIGKAAQYGIDQMIASLQARGCKVDQVESLDAAGSDHILLLGTLEESEVVRSLQDENRIDLPQGKESLAVKRHKEENRDVLIIAGSDDRGLMYAVLEAAQQIIALEEDANWFFSLQEISESPLVPVRSMAVLLHNEDCEKDWYYSEEYWQEYMGMLADNRWNHFC